MTHLLTGKHNYSSGLQITLGNKYTRLSSIHLPFPSHELFHLTEIKYKVISSLRRQFDLVEEEMEEIEVQQRYKFDISQELVLPEFYNQHKNNLPMLIVVSGGYYGQTKYDDMSTDQVCKGKTLRKYLNSEYTMLHTVA